MKIIDVIQALFPNGYLDFAAYNSVSKAKPATQRSPIGALPFLCTDLFAIVAVLLQRSGAYHHVAPDSHAPHTHRTLGVTQQERTDWVAWGEQWRGDHRNGAEPPPQPLVALWAQFWASRDSDVFAPLSEDGDPPAWWRPALALMCVADEAARRLGFEPPAGKAASFQSALIASVVTTKIVDDSAIFTISTAEPDLACVLPKSRTPTVGCTLRSLSHNLALLPPRGLARAYWLASGNGAAREAKVASTQGAPPKSLNCLLVPMPFRVPARSIRGVRRAEERWGWFQLVPEWCLSSEGADAKDHVGSLDQFWSFIHELIQTAERDVGEVHVLVFPEAALSSFVFRDLEQRLKNTHVELLIAGLFDKTNAEGGDYEHGNYAALAVIGDEGLISYRQKHHRWRLDRSQIQTYALGSSLDPNYGWWEDIDILSRSLDVYVLRGTTTVTTLICEDLARHDPCQELVRGIGPNLVFALLMDGPQLKARWPARYATVLAEDPGSSVLSFTSLGLIERSNATGLVEPCRKIGLWRDDRGETIELTIPRGAHALCLSLQPTWFEEHTLDGRSDGGLSESWRLSGVQPVSATSAPAINDVINGRWPQTASAD